VAIGAHDAACSAPSAQLWPVTVASQERYRITGVATIQVYVDDAPELVRLLAGGRHGGAYPRVVDEDVDVAEGIDRRLDQTAAVAGIRYIGANGEGTAPGSLDGGSRILQPVNPAARQDHVGSGLSERADKGDARS
jgi:hypothetical protein